MRKPMPEAAAWREVGRRIEEREGLVHRNGLCHEMNDFDTDDDKWSYQSARIREHVEASAAGTDPAAWVYHEDWEARCLAAYWLALECDDEARDAC